jgi:hypothetical protein
MGWPFPMQVTALPFSLSLQGEGDRIIVLPTHVLSEEQNPITGL